MGSTEADHSPKETAAEKIAKAIAKSEPHLLAESWLTAKDLKTTTAAAPASAPEATAAVAPKTAPQPKDAKVEVASATAGRLPLQLADAHQDSFRQAVATEDQTIAARLKHNIQISQSGAFAIGDVLKNFDSLAQHVTQINLAGVYADFNTIKNDPSKKADAANEAELLHAPGVILANKAMVAYDAAFKPNADSGTPNRKQLIEIARQSMADASQDKAVAQQFASRYQTYEGRVVAYHYAPAIGTAPTDSAPQLAPGPAPAEKQPPAAAPAPAEKQPPAAAPAPVEKLPNPAAQPDKRHDAPQGQLDKPLTDQDLAALAKDAQNHDPAKKALEQQLWGDPNVPANSAKYLTAKKDIFYILNGMTGYTQQQRDDFQVKVFGTGNSVQDKQHYIDTVAAKDPTLHAAASDILQLAGNKVSTVANWYNEESHADAACSASYQKAIAADNAGKLDQANAYWHSAQKYPLESTFASAFVQDPDVIRMDAKYTGDSDDLLAMGKAAAKGGDYKSAAKLLNDSVQAADIFYKANIADAKKAVSDAQQKLANGASLSPDDKLAIASKAFPYARVLTLPIEARNSAAVALSGLDHNDKGQYVVGPGGQKYQAQIATWLNDSTALSKDVDTTTIKAIGKALQSAYSDDPSLKAAGQQDTRNSVKIEAALLIGGTLPDTKNTDGTTTPGQNIAGSAELPYTSPRTLAAYLITQGRGADAIAAVKESAQREAAITGWDLKDVALKDSNLGRVVDQAKTVDPKHLLDQLTANEAQNKTPWQAFGGAAAFAAGVYLAERYKSTALLEDAAAGMEKGTWLAATAKYAPTIAGTTAAVATSYGIDRFGTTHGSVLSDAAKGLSIVALVKGGKYLSRIGVNGFAPEAAENLFGAAKVGGELNATKVFGRMVTDISGKPLAESEVTVGKLAENLNGKLSAANLEKLKALPQDVPVFSKGGVINPKVNEAFLGTSQRELAKMSSEALPKTGAFVPTRSEVTGMLKGTPIDITNGDANVINRQLALRTKAANLIGTGTAARATEKGVLQRVAMEVSATDKVGESSLTRQQLLDYAKARNVPTKQLGKLSSVVGEDAPILQAGKFSKDLGTVDRDLQAELRTIAKTSGKAGNLTSEQLVNYANTNKIPLSKFESVLKQDPVLIRNGQWNPNLLIQDAKTGVVTRAIDTPNFKGVMNLDHLQNTQLFSKLAKNGESEKSVLVRLAQRQSQEVVGDGAGNITKAQYVQRMVDAGETPEAIAKKYPNLSKINDNDLIVKNGKYQPKIEQRDLPENMTAGQFKDLYLKKTGVDLRDPAQLAASPWNRALKTVSDDATIMKDGKWQFNRFAFRVPSKEANALINEQTVDIGSAKGIGLSQSGGKFLMANEKANLNAGQLLAFMKEAKLDPSKLETLSKMSPDAPIVLDGKLVRAQLSPTANKFTLALTKPISLGTSQGQRAILLGEATDGEVSPGLNLAQNWKKYAVRPDKLVGKIGVTASSAVRDNVKSFGSTVIDTWGGTKALGPVDPLLGKFSVQGARYGLQNWASGTAGVLGSYTLYQGLQTGFGDNFDLNGNRISTSDAFENKMLGVGHSTDPSKQIGNLAYHNMWMPQFYSAFQDVGKFPWAAVGFTAALPLAADAVSGASKQLKGTNDILKQQLDLNNQPLVDNPDLVVPEAPQPAQAPPPDSTAAPKAAPADDLVPTPN